MITLFCWGNQKQRRRRSSSAQFSEDTVTHLCHILVLNILSFVFKEEAEMTLDHDSMPDASSRSKSFSVTEREFGGHHFYQSQVWGFDSENIIIRQQATYEVNF